MKKIQMAPGQMTGGQSKSNPVWGGPEVDMRVGSRPGSLQAFLPGAASELGKDEGQRLQKTLWFKTHFSLALLIFIPTSFSADLQFLSDPFVINL